MVFDNSLADGSWYYSHSHVVAPRELDQADGKIPGDGDHFLTPPNALRVKWRSATGGDWSVSLDVQEWYGRVEFAGSSLRMWCYAQDAISAEQAPRIALSDSDHHGTPAIPLFNAKNVPAAGKWMQEELPFDSVVGIMRDTRLDIFDPRKLERIMIFQGLDDAKPHTVYIDEITIDDAQPASAKAPLLRQDKQSALSEAVSTSTHAMSDDQLLTIVQEACFRYYWEAPHPNAGMAIEILPGDKNLVALGSSGFGIM